MKKLEKDLYIKHAKRLQAILNKDSTFAPYLVRPDFNTVIKNELNVLSACEKLFPKVELAAKYSSSALVKEFNTLAKEKFNLDLTFKYDDETDLIDAINYLTMFCKNMFKVDVDELVEGKKVSAVNPTIELRDKPLEGEEPGMDAANAFNMGAMGFGASPTENPYLMGKAYAKLNKEIAEGQIYQYKTKPRAVPIAKLLLTITIGLTCLAVLLAAIFCFMANGLAFNTDDKENPVVYLSVISSGIFYLIICGFGGYTLSTSIKSLIKVKGKTNENKLYSFSWPFYLSFIVLAIIITIFDTITVAGIWNNSINKVVSQSGVHWIGFKGWSILVFIVLGFAALCIPSLIVGAVKSPKPDREKLEGILQQYINDMSKVGPQQPTMDVQTPVKVETKEEDKPKKPGKKPEKK